MAEESKIINLSDLDSMELADDSLLVFGGSFDPVHSGHVSVIHRLQPYFKNILLAPTSQNPWKDENATELELRVKMLELVSEAENLNVDIYTEGYIYAEELVKNLPGDIYWAIGEDLRESVSSWKNWASLGITAVVVPFTENVSATDVREGKSKPHPAIVSFIFENNIY